MEYLCCVKSYELFRLKRMGHTDAQDKIYGDDVTRARKWLARNRHGYKSAYIAGYEDAIAQVEAANLAKLAVEGVG